MKSREQRAHWDEKYEESLVSLTKPDPFFLYAYEQYICESNLSAGAALDLAGGIGRHALWLAHRAWKVSVVDISTVAINRLRQEAIQLNLELGLFVSDAAEFQLESEQFDLIVLFTIWIALYTPASFPA